MKDLNNRKIYIYGAGTLGKKLWECFDCTGVRPTMFIVSKKTEEDMVLDTPVCDLKEMGNYSFDNVIIYVAMNKKYHNEVRSNIKKLKNIDEKNIFFWDESDVYRFYRKVHKFEMANVLNNTRPISEEWGYDRGIPIDRYYIENFLRNEKKNNPLLMSVKNILEVGDLRYSNEFFRNVNAEILDHSVGMDLTIKESLPKEKYDLFICTQTFHQIFEIDKAIEGAWYLLKHGGIMLATTCGCITKLANNSDYTHYWGLTEVTLNKMLKKVFGDNVKTKSYGNAMAATAFVQGLAVEDVNSNLLDELDSDFSICLSAVAIKR